jgi:pimeloyl-ACP methyl ester carboxylesterase
MMWANWRLLIIGWIALLAGGGLGYAVQHAGGVAIEDVRFEFEPGKQLSALIYRPSNATPATPAAGILAVHGYINSRETQSGFAIEFARRGYVVLAIDQTGHGFSEGVAFSAGFGGPAALRYLRSLPYVDNNRIGLEGHSMGGWASLAAAVDQSEGYRAIALVGSSTGAPFAAPGTPSFPRNLGVIFSRYDEFGQLMWGVRDARDIVSSDKLKAVFGTDQTIEPGRVYGSIAQGTARWLAVPATTHPGDHLSIEAIGDTLTWMDLTLAGSVARLESDDQIWYWKELGTLAAFIGGILILLGTIDGLLGLRSFTELKRPAQAAVVQPDIKWWTSALLTALVPAALYFPLTGVGAVFTPNGFFPQAVTNQILVWALGTGLAALALAFVQRRSVGQPWTENFGRPGYYILALLSVGSLYAAVAVSDWVFKTDLRFWVVALKPMAAHHVLTFCAYLIPFSAFFYVTQRLWHQRSSLQSSAFIQYMSSLTVTVAGIFVLVAAVYAWLFVAGHLPGVDPLFSIVAIQFIPILAVTSIVAVFSWRRTGTSLPGALVCGLFVTWYIVAGQATHV